MKTFVFLVLPVLVNSFQSHGFRSNIIRCKALNVASLRAEWDDESLAGSREGGSQRKLKSSFLSDLDLSIGVLITKSALGTVSYYMMEFHDEVNEQWMMGYNNYRKNGYQFPDGLWTTYIERMIKTDRLQIDVRVPASKATRKARGIPEGSNIVMQYVHELEPRKIAHQIITVREDVSAEMIQDLGCVHLENVEAIRFATVWARDGLEVAERSRRMTRMCEQGEATPLRDGNYVNFDVMITALAIQLVRDDLVLTKDTMALEIMEELIINLGVDNGNLTMTERIIHDTHGPRTLLERLYYKGITDGVTGNGKNKINILKVAENLFDARLVIAKEASKLLSLQSLQNRHYYKMIKDCGGFPKFDMSSGVPKFKMVDLDKLEIDDKKIAAEEAFKLQEISKNLVPEDIIDIQFNVESNTESNKVLSNCTIVNEVELDIGDYEIPTSGPMMM